MCNEKGIKSNAPGNTLIEFVYIIVYIGPAVIAISDSNDIPKAKICPISACGIIFDSRDRTIGLTTADIIRKETAGNEIVIRLLL